MALSFPNNLRVRFKYDCHGCCSCTVKSSWFERNVTYCLRCPDERHLFLYYSHFVVRSQCIVPGIVCDALLNAHCIFQHLSAIVRSYIASIMTPMIRGRMMMMVSQWNICTRSSRASNLEGGGPQAMLIGPPEEGTQP